MAETERPADNQPKFNFKTGTISLGQDLAALTLPEGFKYLDSADAKTFLEKVWSNPNGSGTLGMFFSSDPEKGVDPSWGVVITYEEDGHVSDEDASTIDYDKLLQEMKEQTREANVERQKQGFPPIEIVKWALPPRYEASTHKLYWAKELKFDSHQDTTLNYNIRILGRQGVLNLNVVAGMEQLDFINSKISSILGMVDFNNGQRYADYNPSVDRLAAYGIGGLIAGKIAAKAGLFKVLLGALLAAKKFVLVAIVGLGAWLKKIFSKKAPEV